MSERYVPVSLLFLAAAFSLPANPISPYSVPVISEVQWTDPTHWSIEVSNRFWTATTDSCLNGFVKLYIASRKKMYDTRICFNDSGFGVLTMSSIIPAPGDTPGYIMKNDTIYIPDPEVPGAQFPETGWSCAIHNLREGYSLLGFRGPEYFETVRSSIGSAGNYTTVHHLSILDQNGDPFPATAFFSKSENTYCCRQRDVCSSPRIPVYIIR